MKVAIIGSRDLFLDDFGAYLPADTTEIVSGGARGIDSCAAAYARRHHLKLTVFLPDYQQFGRPAPLRRNLQIIEYADVVLAFWDGHSAGTRHVIEHCRQSGKPVRVFLKKNA
ncbi:MAG: SLOG family protein [Eubacteriales bacterium]